MRVLVTGAAGYLGGAVVPALVTSGFLVRALVRGTPPEHLRETEVVRGDVVTGAGVEAAAADCAAVVHLVGIIRERPGATMAGVHVEGTRRVLRAAQRAGARRFVHLSAVGADVRGPTAYQRSKGAAEALVTSSDLAWTVIRPTVVFGPGGPGDNLVRQLGGLLSAAPWVPVVGDGRYLLQPVAAPDVATLCARSLQSPATAGGIYEAGGPERLTYLEVLRRIAAASGRPLRPLHVPVGLIRPLLPLLEHVPGFPLTADQLTMLLRGNVCDAEPCWAAFGLTPQRFTGR